MHQMLPITISLFALAISLVTTYLQFFRESSSLVVVIDNLRFGTYNDKPACFVDIIASNSGNKPTGILDATFLSGEYTVSANETNFVGSILGKNSTAEAGNILINGGSMISETMIFESCNIKEFYGFVAEENHNMLVLHFLSVDHRGELFTSDIHFAESEMLDESEEVKITFFFHDPIVLNARQSLHFPGGRSGDAHIHLYRNKDDELAFEYVTERRFSHRP